MVAAQLLQALHLTRIRQDIKRISITCSNRVQIHFLPLFKLFTCKRLACRLRIMKGAFEEPECRAPLQTIWWLEVTPDFVNQIPNIMSKCEQMFIENCKVRLNGLDGCFNFIFIVDITKEVNLKINISDNYQSVSMLES
jgi:hypothetical protein